MVCGPWGEIFLSMQEATRVSSLQRNVLLSKTHKFETFSQSESECSSLTATNSVLTRALWHRFNNQSDLELKPARIMMNVVFARKR